MKFKKISIGKIKKLGIFFLPVLALIVISSLVILLGKTAGKVEEISVKLDDETFKMVQNKDFSKISVYISQSGEIVKVDLEDYVLGVISGEMPAAFNEEALKAQAVVARTYAVKRLIYPCEKAEGADICDSVHCQVYMNKKDRMNSWDKNKAQDYWDKLQRAVSSTKGEVLTYNGELVLYPQFFSTSWGKTEDCSAVFSLSLPYLKSVSSPGEDEAPKYKSKTIISSTQFINKINSNFKGANLNISNLRNSVKISSRNQGGSVNEIKIGDTSIKGTQFRSVFDLNSANFNISFTNKAVVIETSGYGHGVGMSQWGANAMAEKGAKYNEILSHYYNGIQLNNISELKFVR